MTEKLFSSVLEIGLGAGLFLLLVIALRGLFRRTPHRVFVLLWLLAGLRLLIPVNIESPFSARGMVERWQMEHKEPVGALRPSEEEKEAADVMRPSGEVKEAAGDLADFGNLLAADHVPAIDIIPSAEQTEAGAVSAGTHDASDRPSAPELRGQKVSVMRIASVLWLCGAALWLLYGIARYLWLRVRLRDSVRLDGNVWQSDRIRTPFLFGVVRPGIYVPFGLGGKLPYVLAHERAHLRHGDHLVKALWFVVLALYWFHPLVWLAYGLMGRDMELACDERVVAGLDDREKGGYARALLEVSMEERPLLFRPLAFGEVGVKMRIMHVLSYKKPALFGALTCLAIGVVFAALLLTDPSPMNAQPDNGNAGVSGEQSDNGNAGVPGEQPDNGNAGVLGEQPDNGNAGVSGEQPDSGKYNSYIRYEGKFRIDENGSYNGSEGPWSYDYQLSVYYKDGRYKANECLEPWDRSREKTDQIYCGAVDLSQGQSEFANRERLLDSCGYYEELRYFEDRDLRDMELRPYRETQWYVDTEEVYADGGAQTISVEHWMDRETMTSVRKIVTSPGVYVEKRYIVLNDIVSDKDMLIDPDQYMETASGRYVRRQEADPREELWELLRRIRDDVQPGTLGSSLKAGSVAVRLLRWAGTSSLSVEEVKAITAEFLAAEEEQYEAFSEGVALDRYGMFMECIESVDYACGILQSDRAMGILDSIGMEQSDISWGDEPLPLVEAIMETAGLR